jgi:hypothetical protein
MGQTTVDQPPLGNTATAPSHAHACRADKRSNKATKPSRYVRRAGTSAETLSGLFRQAAILVRLSLVRPQTKGCGRLGAGLRQSGCATMITHARAHALTHVARAHKSKATPKSKAHAHTHGVTRQPPAAKPAPSVVNPSSGGTERRAHDTTWRRFCCPGTHRTPTHAQPHPTTGGVTCRAPPPQCRSPVAALAQRR